MDAVVMAVAAVYVVGWVATLAMVQWTRDHDPDEEDEDPLWTATKWPLIAAVWLVLLGVVGWQALDGALRRRGL